jgi:valyl-tRNA synthetase
LQEAEGEIARLESKLADDQFRSKAPEHVVSREEERLAGATTRADGLRARLQELE